MRNALSLITKYILTRIPQEILVEAFKPHETHRSIDALIKEHVIVDQVLAQANLVTGKTTKITIKQEYLKPLDDRNVEHYMSFRFSTYQIPPEARENRAITMVLDLAYPHNFAYTHSMFLGDGSGLSVGNRMDEMLTSVTRVPGHLTPQPILVDGNAGIVRLDPPMSVHTDFILSCSLELDPNLTGVSQNLIPLLQDMCLYATQMYCYNVLWVRVNQGFLVGGQQLEAIRSILEEYRDADEKFREALLKFRGGTMFSRDNLAGFIGLMTGS